MFMHDLMKDETLAVVQRLLEVAAGAGYPLAQLALAWVLRQPNVSSAITGASRPQQVDENDRAVDITQHGDMLHRIVDTLGSVVRYAHCRIRGRITKSICGGLGACRLPPAACRLPRA